MVVWLRSMLLRFRREQRPHRVDIFLLLWGHDCIAGRSASFLLLKRLEGLDNNTDDKIEDEKGTNENENHEIPVRGLVRVTRGLLPDFPGVRCRLHYFHPTLKCS